jgi:uncharacterized protein
MIVYKSNTHGFLSDVRSNTLEQKINQAVLDSFGWRKVNTKERNAWSNSMQFMGNVIMNAGLAEDCGILIEYNLPSTSLRVDFIISGQDETGKSSFIIIELKQWRDGEVSSTTLDGIVNTKYYGNTTHPSYQAFSYKLYLSDFNESIFNSSIRAHSCSYLHNYVEQTPEPLKADIYKAILRDSPIYLQQDQLQLEEFIRIHVGRGKGESILYQIENGAIRPSKKLIDHVTKLFAGNSEFVLLDDQKLAFEAAMKLAICAKDKTVIVIKGGPGTGKSVISMNLLGSLLTAQQNVKFVAPNASFRDVMVDKLTQSNSSARVDHLLKGSGAFVGCRKNTFDVLVVDEAHRLKDGSAFMYKGENQIEDIMNASRVSIFFIDEKQVIRPGDIGTEKEIIRLAEKYKANFEKFQLKAQFRCAGADGYINWLDDVLQLEATGNFDGWDKKDFDFKIFSNPDHLRREIKAKVDVGLSARILAGYSWEWTSAKDGNSNGQIADIEIKEFDFRMPWNSRSVGTTWAIDPTGINQVGCVHTSQGLEFDYVGVIIGKDLQFDVSKNEFITKWEEYKDSKGKQGLKKNPVALNQLVRNIYRILLTRGMKGCYVYCVDKNIEAYLKSSLGRKPAEYSLNPNDVLPLAAEE